MCFGCWEESEKPAIDTPLVREAADAIRAVYAEEWGVCGGNLHIVLDDWNIEDENVQWCSRVIDGAGVMPDDDGQPLAECHLRYNDEKRKNPDSPEQVAIERKCCDLLLQLTEEERASALALVDGFWEPAAN